MSERNVRELVLVRDVTKAECDWLEIDLPKGTRVFEYHGPTYGCIGDWGTASTARPNETPFFELPDTAIIPASLTSPGE